MYEKLIGQEDVYCDKCGESLSLIDSTTFGEYCNLIFYCDECEIKYSFNYYFNTKQLMNEELTTLK